MPKLTHLFQQDFKMFAMKFVFLVLAFFVMARAEALVFSCDLPEEKKDLKCSGNFKAKNLTDLNLYKSSLGLKNNKAQNLEIDFDVTGVIPVPYDF